MCLTRILGFETLEPRLLFSSVINYPWADTVPESALYAVTAYHDGQVTDLFTHFSEPQLEQGQDGDGVTGVLEDRTMSYVQFAFEGQIEIEVTKLYGTAAPRVEISPNAYGIDPHYFDGRTVRFMVENLPDRTEYISVNFVTPDNQDGDGAGGFDIKNAMMLFGDAPETDVPDPDAPGVVVYSDAVTNNQLANADVIYFAPGDYDLEERFPTNPRKASLPMGKNGQEVYVAGGAFVRGAVEGDGYDNLRVYGRGIFTGENLAWHEIRDSDGNKDPFLDFRGSNDSTFEGFVVVNPVHHTMPSSKNTTIRNTKIIGWASNHDGVRPGSGSTVDGVFIKTSDDYDYARDPHTFENSVLWPMRNGATGQLGWNNLGTGGAEYRNNHFINAEWQIYKRNRGVIGSVLEQGANLSGNVVENLYANQHLSLLANLTMQREPSDPFNANNPGLIEDFTFRNIIIDDFTAANGQIIKNPISGFEYNGAKAMIKDIAFINLVVGNQLVTQQNYSTWFDIDPNTTENITFTTEGPIYTVNATAGPNGSMMAEGGLPTPAGMDRSVTIVPDPGYRIASVIVDGVDMGRMQNVLFEDVSANHSVVAFFEPGNDYFDNPVVVTNSPPSVDAGTDQVLSFPVLSTALDATVFDDGLPDPPSTLTYAWSVHTAPTGETAAFTNPNAEDTGVSFSGLGEYVLRLTVSDGDLVSTDDVTVAVTTDPLEFAPTDDAYLQGSTAFNNNLLRVEPGARTSYFKFDVSGLDGLTVTGAILVLTEGGDTSSGVTLELSLGETNGWTQSTLTTGNAPQAGVLLDTRSGAVGTSEQVAFDVSNAVTGDGLYSFVLSAASGNDVAFGSMESGVTPRLLIDAVAAAIPGDADGDGDVDDTDLGLAIANFTGPVGAAGNKTAAQGDADGDGDVDDTDLGVAIAGFTGPLAPLALTAAPSPSPEPAMPESWYAAASLLDRLRQAGLTRLQTVSALIATEDQDASPTPEDWAQAGLAGQDTQGPGL